MSQETQSIEVDRSYSAVLLGLGLFFLMGALRIGYGAQGDGQQLAAVHFVVNILLFLGVSSLATAILRWLRLPICLPVTAAASILLAIAFPVGTVAFWYWLTKVKPRELKVASDSERRSFLYTVGLYVAGLVLCLPALVFQFAANTSPPDSRGFWETFGLCFFVAAFLFLAVGALRSLKKPVAYFATLILNVLLVLYLPIGTCFALYWFLSVRKHDLLVYRGQGEA